MKRRKRRILDADEPRLMFDCGEGRGGMRDR